MKQLYCIVDDLITTKQIVDELYALNIGESNFYVWSRNDAGLIKNNIHPANPVQQQDIIHSGEQGAILGLVGGLILLSTIVLFHPFSIEVGWGISLAVIIFVTFFGAWVGGIVGISHDNYKISKFRDSIDAGKHLLVVEVPRHQIRKIMRVLGSHRQSATLEGMDDTVINPMDHFPFKGLKTSRF